MTRINCVDPSVLTTKHLIAEWHELPRVFTLILAHCKKLQSAHYATDVRWLLSVHREYKMGIGHVKFFYPRAQWLKERYVALYKEMHRRRMNVNTGILKSNLMKAKAIPTQYCNSWVPTPTDWEKNIERLYEKNPQAYSKIKVRPTWYGF